MKKLFAWLSMILGIAVIICGFTVKNTAGKVVCGVGLVIVVVSGVEIIGISGRRRDGSDEDVREEKELPQYARKKAYITRPEAALFKSLKEIDPDRYEVFPQAALNSVIDKVTHNAYRNELFRVVDFVFTDKNDYEPLLLVELNDASHMRPERSERDRKVREICERAGLPLVSFTVAESRDFRLVRHTVLKNILKK